MKHIETIAPDPESEPKTSVDITSADDAPETVLDLRRPDPEAAVAAGEVVQPSSTPQPQQPAQLIVVLGRTLVREAHLLQPTINVGRDARQDLATPVRLIAQKPHIFLQLMVIGRRQIHLFGHQ